MPKKIIVANWKMNPSTVDEAENLLDNVLQGINVGRNEVIICPPFLYLPRIKEALDYKEKEGVVLGAQNAYLQNKGAFTGEISPLMLKHVGVEYVILGHSERRKHFFETDQMINKKIKACLENGLKVVFCIGETDEERVAGEKEKVLTQQIQKGLLDITDFKNIIVAYEPVWAIGTGNSCSIQETKNSVDFIRKLVNNKTRVLYGGSVNKDNAKEYVKEGKVDGLIVGGESLMPENFIHLVNSL